ncbi:MAG: DUF6702 family protein [Bacteroidota bacterium]|nr:DUF6702 family protein [Bacteroidota bacterium]
MLKCLIIACIVFTLSAFHPFYLGVTHFKLNKKSNTLETSVKLFTNDLETSLKKLNGNSVDLINGSNKEEINKLINKYLQARLIIKVNGKNAAFNYIGFETEKDVTWIFIEYKKIRSLKSLDIENTLLYDSFDKQTNIIRVETSAGEQNSKISCPEKTAKFSFK